MEIVSIAVSRTAGVPKRPVPKAYLAANHGIKGDAHAGPWHRQVSFLPAESIETLRGQGFDVNFGSFAENIATRGIDWSQIAVGSWLSLGSSAVVEITQKGKTCHAKCSIYSMTGDCIMPKQGIFARVVKTGAIRTGDVIRFQ